MSRRAFVSVYCFILVHLCLLVTFTVTPTDPTRKQTYILCFFLGTLIPLSLLKQCVRLLSQSVVISEGGRG